MRMTCSLAPPCSGPYSAATAAATQPVVSAPAVAEERQPYDGDTAFKLYLREVSETPLLTIAEEKKNSLRGSDVETSKRANR